MQEIDDESNDTVEQEDPNTPDAAYITTPNTPGHAEQKPPEVMLISAHAVEGTPGAAMFSLLLNLGGYQAVALVDSGSSHTFMNYVFSIAANCHLNSTPTKRVSVAGGGQLISLMIQFL